MPERRQMHLQDLFRTGVEIKFELEFEDEPVEILMWMRKPTAGHQDEAMNKARGIQARRKKMYRDKDSDEYLAMEGDVETFDDVKELREQLLVFEVQRLRSQAFNEVLHDENFIPKDDDGEPIWGEDNTAYLDLLLGINQRIEEISKWNDSLEEGEEELKKDILTDEELLGLQADRDKFEENVTARVETLEKEKLKEWVGKKIPELRKILLKKMIDTNTALTWFEEYRKYMLFFACRDYDNRSKTYFETPDEILGLPPAVLSYLESQLEDLDKPADALKNLPSLQSSSESSESE